MFDINTKNVKKGKNIFYIFLAAGLLFLVIIGGVFVSSIVKLNSLDSTVLSERVEIKSYIDDEGTIMYSPVYYYSVNGKNYTCVSNSPSSHNPGTQNKNVYYDSNNPSKCMTEYSKSSNFILLVFIIIPIIFILVAVVNIRKVNKRVKAILELNNKGKLIKNLPYRLENTGTVVNGVPIQRPVVDYTLSSGAQITLYGDPRNDKKQSDSDGMVDLLIDESNLNNYYIDFEINRLSGNLPQDYYQQPMMNSNNLYTQPQPTSVQATPSIQQSPVVPGYSTLTMVNEQSQVQQSNQIN